MIDYIEKIQTTSIWSGSRTAARSRTLATSFLGWWSDMVHESSNYEVYLRRRPASNPTAGRNLVMSECPEYRWGISCNLVTKPAKSISGVTRPSRLQDVPANIAHLARVIVTQGDTEPASVEQQKALDSPALPSTTCEIFSR